MTHDDIAKITATSRQTVTLVLNDLRSKGLIDYGSKSLTIPLSKIKEFGENLNVTHKKIKIDNSAVNITVNLHMSIDADDLAANLAKKNSHRKNSVQLSVKEGKSHPK